MTKQRLQIGIALLTILAVVIALVAWSRSGEVQYPTDWFSLDTPTTFESVPKGNSVGVEKDAASVGYSGEAIICDIPFLDVLSTTGRAKFLPYTATKSRLCSIGYVIDVESKPLRKDKLPDKYKKTVIIPTAGGPLTVLPLDEATYEVYFVLRLLDADGFEILKAESPRHHVRSGETSHIQSQTSPVISPEQAVLTERITLHMVVDKCLSANDKTRE